MSTQHRQPAETHPIALATTLGTFVEDSAARPLGAAGQAQLESWREDAWQALEVRLGQLAPRDPALWYELLAFEAWRLQVGDTSVPEALLDLFYRVKPLIPRSVQLSLRRLLARRQGGSRFPAWPLEPAGCELIQIAVADALLERGVSALRFPWFWPRGYTAAATLTHDVESADGLARASIVAEWEEQHGFRSSFNVVADWYPIDIGTLRELSERGHEIGSHGICHDRSLFASRASFERQLPLLCEFAGRVGAVGFRSPATHRVVDWLADLPFSYDCTMPHSDPYEPVPGGTATLWPFFHGDVVELPYTAPQDHTLYNLLGHEDSALWRAQLAEVVGRHGLFQTITHPDAGYLARPEVGRAYRELLESIALRCDVWVALPREVALWWRNRRDGFTPRDDGVATWTGSAISIAPSASFSAKRERPSERLLSPAGGAAL
jgi:peptidoglycan/xylan/chitin deacetylase (PgdA/CDA1 family)